jgi:hypothetical protein
MLAATTKLATPTDAGNHDQPRNTTDAGKDDESRKTHRCRDTIRTYRSYSERSADRGLNGAASDVVGEMLPMALPALARLQYF